MQLRPQGAEPVFDERPPSEPLPALPLKLTHQYGKLFVELFSVPQALRDRVEAIRSARVAEQVQLAREAFLALPERAAVHDAEDRLRIAEDTLAVGLNALAKIREQLADPELAEEEIAKLLKRQGELTIKIQAMDIRVTALKEHLAVKKIDFEAAFYDKKQALAAAYRQEAHAREIAALEALRAALFAMPELESALAAAAPDDPFEPLLWQTRQMPTASEILSV
jgi:hypothetical protein